MSLFGKLFGKQGEGKGTEGTAGDTPEQAMQGTEQGSQARDEGQQAEIVEAREMLATYGEDGLPSTEPPPLSEESAADATETSQAETPLNSGGAPGRGEVLAFPGRAREAEPTEPATRTQAPAGERPEPVSISSGQQRAEPQQPGQPPTLQEMRNDPNFLRVFDQYGQEVFVSRQQWREEILPNNIQAAWNNPDELYGVLLNGINDGLFAEIEPAAVHLREIDPQPARAACLLAVVQLQLGQPEVAERTLEQTLERDGEDAAVLTNMSRMVAGRGDRERAEGMLWRALELDPNLENALAWFVGVEQERDPEGGKDRALDRVEQLPGSWRASLWKAKAALEANDLPRALALYRTGLASFSGPVSPEFLYPMSGDLGMAGHLRELLELTEPRFIPEVHGLPVGNNLIKAHFDLGELDQAAAITARLFAMRRPDWREPLGFWEQTIGRAQRAQQPALESQGPLEVGMLEMIGPVWRRVNGPLEPVFGLNKRDGAPVVTILGGSADLPPVQGEVAMQMADAVGRLSRAMPLFLAEQVEFHTEAQARTLLPRVAGAGGFVLRGSAWSDPEALELAREAELPPDFVVRAHLDTQAPTWVASAQLTRAQDGTELGVVRAEFPAGQPEYGMPALASALERLLGQQGVRSQAAPATYQVPDTGALANYLLRLEQLLTLRTAVTATTAAQPTSGEREVMEGVLGLALQQPRNATVRALLAATTMTMWQLRPAIAEEFEDRLELLGREQPLGEPLDGIILAMVTDEV